MTYPWHMFPVPTVGGNLAVFVALYHCFHTQKCSKLYVPECILNSGAHKHGLAIFEFPFHKGSATHLGWFLMAPCGLGGMVYCCGSHVGRIQPSDNPFLGCMMMYIIIVSYDCSCKSGYPCVMDRFLGEKWSRTPWGFHHGKLVNSHRTTLAFSIPSGTSRKQSWGYWRASSSGWSNRLEVGHADDFLVLILYHLFFLGKPIHGGELTVRGVNCDPLLEWYPINQWNRFCHCYRNCDSEKDELFPLDFLDGYTNIILHLHYPTDDSSNNLPIYNFHIFPSIPTISHHVSMTFPI